MIVVLGGGLAGLSAAYHLQDREETIVLEKEALPGGLCRSIVSDGFTFDLTGHLLHLRRPEIIALVEDLIPKERFVRIDRRSFIWSHGTLTPYPFQVNTHGLPPEVISECLTGFVEALVKGTATPLSDDAVAGLSFKEWVLRTFGSGIARHFMIPYNEKLWLTDLSEVTSDWVSWSIPRPSLADVVDGALGISRKAFGYNPSFLYPKEGGIRVLPDALASRVRGLRCGEEVVRIDTKTRTAIMKTRERIDYDRLISTMPLPRLLAIADGIPPSLVDEARALRHVAVINMNFGIDREIHSDKHWIYFPDPEVVFYRAGFPASFTAAAAPAGCSSIYMEIAVPPDAPWGPAEEEAVAARCWQSLLAAGIVKPEDRIMTRVALRIDPAYVIYDRKRRDLLPKIHTALSAAGIHSIGRYGAWHYNSMEDSLAEGRALAHELLDARIAAARTAGA